MTLLNFTDKCILITGGSRGIGRATALAFAKQGAKVAISYRSNEVAAKETINQLHGTGHLAIQADMQQAEAIRQLVNETIKTFGRLDVVINNAGVFLPHPVDILSYDQWQQAWQQTLSVNLSGPANLCYCAAQYMKLQGGGRIINVSSRGAFRGEPNQPAYAASKAGLNALSQSLAQALAKHQIFVGVVAPGFVETDMTRDLLASPAGAAIRQQSPLKRVAYPQEVARAILFLADEGTEYLSGAILDVNGASYLRS